MDKKSLQQKQTDFLVIGTGIAGLYTALNLSKLGKVNILTKEKLEDSNTQYAQGGIAAVLDKGDSLDLHIKDTLEAGAGLCNQEAVEVLVKEGPDRVMELIALGTEFDHIEGELDLSREGAHSKRRILHARGDATGEEIRESLTTVVNRNKNIEIEEESFMVDLILSKKEELEVKGALIWDNKIKNYKIYNSTMVIMASGGCGQVYANTSNPEVTTGDGIAAAYRAGARIEDMEFIQFHPTTFYNPGHSPFLISETVRGEGGVLRNTDGKRFMPDYHQLADLAPRDIVSRAIIKEIESGGKPYVYLDVTDLDGEYIENRFPTIFQRLLKAGVDMRKDLIPVVPAAHYMMGGIKTDTNGRTNIKGFYACGEAACSGVHGANRLASNSLLDGLVFGFRIYKYIKNNIDDLSSVSKKAIIPKFNKYGKNKNQLEQIENKFKEKMMSQAGIVRDKKRLEELINFIEEKIEVINKENRANQKYWELINMLTVGKLIAISSLMRRESRGAHYRTDYPEPKKSWKKKHIIFNKEYPEGKIDVHK